MTVVARCDEVPLGITRSLFSPAGLLHAGLPKQRRRVGRSGAMPRVVPGQFPPSSDFPLLFLREFLGMTQRILSRHNKLLGGIAMILATAVIHPPTGQAETWTSLRGTHSVDAKMIGLWGESVILELSNGRRVSVKLLDLRSESRIQAQQLARELDSSRGDRINELKGQATAAAAPAPDPLPQPAPAPEYVAPQPNLPAADFFDQLDSAIASGHLLAIYDSLPPSYRQDVNEIVQVSAQGMDFAAWQNLIDTLHQLGDLIVTRQKWFLSSPRVQGLSPEQQDLAAGPLLSLAGVLRAGLDPDAMQLEQLKSTDFRQWLVERDQAMAPYLAQLFQQMGVGSLRQVTIESEENGVAVASFTINGAPRRVTYAMVEGYWVPKSLADQWGNLAASWKQGPQSPLATSMASASMMLQVMQPMLGSLASAGDAAAFHSEMEAIFTPAETMITTLASVMGRGMNTQGRGNGPAGYGGYEADMYSEGDMYEEDLYGEEMMESEMEMEDSGSPDPADLYGTGDDPGGMP